MDIRTASTEHHLYLCADLPKDNSVFPANLQEDDLSSSCLYSSSLQPSGLLPSGLLSSKEEQHHDTGQPHYSSYDHHGVDHDLHYHVSGYIANLCDIS